mmetsp:Transcript_45160/g.94012  ORF Transcript_45160/g.94012 Transcript_45160/m.94012 type:complete len:276 (+) Transcript_45160:708-1535(+)
MAAWERREDFVALLPLFLEASLHSVAFDGEDSARSPLVFWAVVSLLAPAVTAGSSERLPLLSSPTSAPRVAAASESRADLPKVARRPRYCLDIKRGIRSFWMEERFLVLATKSCRTQGAKEYTCTSLHSVRITNRSPPWLPRNLDFGTTSLAVEPVMCSSSSTSSFDFFNTMRGRDALLRSLLLLLPNHDDEDDRFWGNDKAMYSMSSLSRDNPPFLALDDSFTGSPCSSSSSTSTNIAVQATSSEAGRIMASKASLFFFSITRSPGNTTIRVWG